MNSSIKQELLNLVFDLVREGTLNRENIEEWQHFAFGRDYHFIGYYKAEQWLQKHDVSPFDAIEYVVEQEIDHFGECRLTAADCDAERIVDLLVYYAGSQLIMEHKQEIIEAAIQAEKNFVAYDKKL